MTHSCENVAIGDVFMRVMDGMTIQTLGKKYLKRVPIKAQLMAQIKRIVPAQLRKALKQLLASYTLEGQQWLIQNL